MAELYGQRIQTTVQTKYLPYVVDTALNSNVLFQRIVRGAKKWSGRTLRVPLKYKKNITGTSFRGFDQFSVNPTDNRQYMEYTPSFYQITCALPGDELSVADTDEKILDLMKLTIQSDTEDMADNLGDLFYLDGTGNGSKDPLGLAALVDDGSNVSTIGGLSRTTYTTLKGTLTAQATLTLASIDTLWINITSGSIMPTVGITTPAVFNFYGQLLRPQERIVKSVSEMKGESFTGGTGFGGRKYGMGGLEYNGKPILMDEKCTAQYFHLLNEDFLEWHALPYKMAKPVAYKSQIEGNDYEAPIGLGFSWTDWIVPVNGASVIGHIYFGGQFIVTNPKRQGKLTTVAGI